MTSPSKPAPNAPRLSLDDVIYILRDPARWKMLAELATGEPRSNQELADVTRLSASAAAKHLEALRYTGVVVKRHGVNYLADGYLSATGSREIDLGGCVLRLDDPKWLKT